MTLEQAQQKFQVALNAVMSSTQTGIDSMAGLFEMSLKRIQELEKEVAELKAKLPKEAGE